jgi:hypothetical protein
VRVLYEGQRELLAVTQASRLLGLGFRTREHGEKDCCQNGNDGYYHQQLDQSETLAQNHNLLHSVIDWAPALSICRL